MSIEELENEFASRSLLVDVRDGQEFAVSHILGAINSQDPAEIVSRFHSSGKEILVLYCSVGRRSSRMAHRVQPLVSGPVYNLEGSIFEWANSGRPVYRGEERVSVVHPYGARWERLLDRALRADSPTPARPSP
jgi:rhodanese-related sulfurtransferase